MIARLIQFEEYKEEEKKEEKEKEEENQRKILGLTWFNFSNKHKSNKLIFSFLIFLFSI